MDSSLVNRSNQVFVFFEECVMPCKMLIESDFAPLSPHDVGLVEVELDDAFTVLFISLDMVPPEALLH